MSQTEICLYCSTPRDEWVSAICDQSETGAHVVFDVDANIEVENPRGLMVKDVEVFSSEILNPGQILFCPPGHQLNPTDGFILAVDLVAYASLESGYEPSVKAAEAFVEESWRVVQNKVRAAHRRAQRARQRSDNAARSRKCNRTTCGHSGANWWNTSTRAYYCQPCAFAINDAAQRFGEKAPCVPAD